MHNAAHFDALLWWRKQRHRRRRERWLRGNGTPGPSPRRRGARGTEANCASAGESARAARHRWLARCAGGGTSESWNLNLRVTP